MNFLFALFSVFLISLISLIGVFFLSFSKSFLVKMTLFLVSLSAGVILGDIFIHLLPELVEEFGFGINISLSILVGILFMFFIEKVVHWHHCHIGDDCEHSNRFGYMNLVGDSLHNFLDGIIVGSAYLIDFGAGVATSIAVLLHEIPQEIGDFGVLVHSGFSKYKALLLNFLTALFSVLGVVLVYLINFDSTLPYLVAFSFGALLYVATSDLIPELNKNFTIKSATMQLLFLVLGILIMVLFSHY